MRWFELGRWGGTNMSWMWWGGLSWEVREGPRVMDVGSQGVRGGGMSNIGPPRILSPTSTIIINKLATKEEISFLPLSP